MRCNMLMHAAPNVMRLRHNHALRQCPLAGVRAENRAILRQACKSACDKLKVAL